MTKTEKIKALLKLDLTTKQIADHVGCRQEYVRTVKQRVAGGGMSKADRNYFARDDVKLRLRHKAAERYYQDDAFRQRVSEYNRRYYAARKSAA